MRKKLFVGACLGLAAAFALGGWYYRRQKSESLGALAKAQAEPFIRPHSPVLGQDTAKVTIVKFTDPACETCAAFAPFVQRFLEAYPERIRLVVRYAPFHEGAPEVARVLEAARLQGKFWDALHMLYASQHLWTHHHEVKMDAVWKLLPEAGVDAARAKKDYADPALKAAVEQDLADAAALGVTKTPGFFVNGRPLEPFGAQPLADLIRSELARHYTD